MSLPVPCLRLCHFAVAAFALTAPARADGNRLLPFWGQPYPYGYAWTRSDPLPRQIGPCERRSDTGRRRGRGRAEPCEVVLHARD